MSAHDTAPVQKAPAPSQAPTEAGPTTTPSADTGTTASALGLLAGNGGFVGKLGAGFRLSAEDLAAGKINLEERRQPIPGVLLKSATYSASKKRVDLKAELAMPHVAKGAFTIRIDRRGTPSLRGTLKHKVELPALGRPTIEVGLDDKGAITGSAEIEAAHFKPSKLKGLKATGSGKIRIASGKVSGSGSATLTYAELGTGTVNFHFTKEGHFAANGSIVITPPFLDEVKGELAVDEKHNITARVDLKAGQLTTSVPGLSVTGGLLVVEYENTKVAAALTGFNAAYAGFGSMKIESASLNRANRFAGKGSLALEVPMMDEVTGKVGIRNGQTWGSLTLKAEHFPDGLPVSRGQITAKIDKAGKLGLAGVVGVDLGPAGKADLAASYDPEAKFAMGVDAQITIPGLQPGKVRVDYASGELSGEAQIPIDTALIPGLAGSVTVRYKENLWSGETTITYSADDGKLSGSVTVTVAQTEKGDLQIGGTGLLTAQLMPGLAGTLTGTILPEGGIDVSGAIEVTEPLELFPEKRVDKELFRYSKNVPLWAMLVAVIRVRAGVRSGIGPGVFRNIRVEGSYTLGAEEADPSFSVTGELFIPAFVEGYAAIGAGLGLDVVLGELTGGIEAIGTAGLYGAIQVVPAINYANGDWTIEGVATLAAGARLKLGLNAWAEIEALWVTVWEKEWELAEVVFPIGPDLSLQARMNYTFGRPEAPEIEMSSSDIDASSLIQEAIPKDGPAGSGAREALKNKAEWRGQLQEQREAPVPPETAAQAQKPAPKPKAPPRPKRSAPPANARQGGAGAKAKGAKGTNQGVGQNQQSPGGTTGPAGQAQRSKAVDDAAGPDRTKPTVPEGSLPKDETKRYRRPLSLATLNEPPVPQPRTPSQEREDVRAAKRLVEIASAQAKTSDSLDDYFPRIKRRFGLSKLGYEGDFQKGFKVVGGVNPDLEVKVTEPLSGSGVSPGHKTEIILRGGSLSGHMVGIHMTASPLGPEHPRGSGPSGQKGLMGMLPTDSKHHPDADTRFVRGHLLNDNLGGPGKPNNLFPITAHANSVHHAEIEKYVKKWVNESRYWVKYDVKIRGGDTIETAPSGIKYVNSTIEATASVLNTKLRAVSGLTRSVTIKSHFETAAKATTTEAVDEAKLAAHTARPIDKGVEVKLPAGRREVIFPSDIEAVLKAKIRSSSRARVKERLRTYSGFGPRSEEVLFKAYDGVKRRKSDKMVRGLSSDEISVFTRIINSWEEAGGGLKGVL